MAILFVVITLFIWMTKYSAAAMKCQLPPGPRGLPLVGNLPFLDPELHNYFAKLTTIYGPIFKLKLGSKLCVVIGSASTAKEVLKDKDTIFANRNTPSSVVTLTYGASDLVWSAYGSHWRTLRLICAQEIFCKKNLDSLNILLRRREIHRMVNFFYSRIDTPINIAEQMHLTSLNVILSMLWGGTLKTVEMSCTGLEFQKATREAVELMWETNMTDFFPILSRFDIQGVVRRMRRVFLWYDCILESIINHRIKFNQAEGINKGSDFLDILLQHMDDGHSKTPITIINVKALLQLQFGVLVPSFPYLLEVAPINGNKLGASWPDTQKSYQISIASSTERRVEIG
ncbi:hypothetical protein IFM89_014025 [Coptis chinensis]|uniref:Cytochrome P450 n=1 Tax=Coptis chinensis TaxID=261450 RepID=A0A835M039_9MAGN|nr:hypothetical protein IFM89_014025 [Coptis chinensis]